MGLLPWWHALPGPKVGVDRAVAHFRIVAGVGAKVAAVRRVPRFHALISAGKKMRDAVQDAHAKLV